MFTLPQYIGPINIVPLIPYLALAIIIGFILLIVPFVIWFERVVIALMQDRLGPNRVGPRGLLQSIADGIKLFFKEDIQPAAADLKIYYLAPILSLIPALAGAATLPFSTITVKMGDGSVQTLPMVVGNVNIGILYILALSSLQVYGIILAGWSSNNKYSLLGGLRSSAQIISYELAMSLAILTGVLMSGSLNLVKIVESQDGGFWNWNFFNVHYWVVPGMVAGMIYLIAMIAETNRAPFDLPEAESELIAGFHTEYTSMKFAMFFMGEYASMMVVSGVATALWFGGWLPPIPALAFLPGGIWFLGKLGFFMGVYVWLRATLPRLRYDALMNIGWKRMLPLALVVLFIVAAIDAFFHTPETKTVTDLTPQPPSLAARTSLEKGEQAPTPGPPPTTLGGASLAPKNRGGENVSARGTDSPFPSANSALSFARGGKGVGGLGQGGAR